jgi:hypothetical protein
MVYDHAGRDISREMAPSDLLKQQLEDGALPGLVKSVKIGKDE